MTDSMRLLLSLSLSGGMLALLLFAMRPWLQRRVSKSLQYYIWVIVLLRLCLPIAFDVNLMDALFSREKSEPTSAVSQQPIPGVQEAQAQPALIASNEAQNTVKRPSSESSGVVFLMQALWRLDIGLCVWGLGAAGFLAWNIATYRRYTQTLRRVSRNASEGDIAVLTELCVAQGIKKTPMLLRANAVQTPMLIGFRQPCILLPEGEFTQVQLSNILTHELTHLRRHDIAMKWLVTMVCALHWFNPIVYVMRREINRACELACDEAVIRSMNIEEKQSYGETLISVVAQSRLPVGAMGTTMSEEKKTLKERLLAIMEHKKNGKRSAVLSSASVLMLLGAALFLGACVQTPPDASDAAGFVDSNNAHPSAFSDDVFEEFTKHRTSYIGDNSAVAALLGRLPLPGESVKQRFFSLETSSKPYALTVYYEPADGASEVPIDLVDDPNSAWQKTLTKNALLLFCGIDNLDVVSFKLRTTPTPENELDMTAYSHSRTTPRAHFAQNGDLHALLEDHDELWAAFADIDAETLTRADTASEQDEEVLTSQSLAKGAIAKPTPDMNETPANIVLPAPLDADATPMPEFAEDEVAAARAVVEKYWEDREKQGDVKLLEIHYDSQDQMRKIYHPNGKEIAKDRIIVLKVDYDVLDKNHPVLNHGEYLNWSMILTRQNAGSPWEIVDQGY